MQVLNFVFLEVFTIKYENLQTIQFLVDKSIQLQAKLYINIYPYCLRKKVQYSSIYIGWVPKKEMIVNGLTNALSSAEKHVSCVKMTGIKDHKHLLAFIKREENTIE